MARDNRRVIRMSVVMPCFNEEATVQRSIERVRSMPATVDGFDGLRLETEIICVDDASTDDTVRILSDLVQKGVVDTLIQQEVNQGKGTAVRAGIARATGDITFIQDADLEYDPHEIPSLIKPILNGRADAVFGSRFLAGSHRVLYFWHRVGNGLLTLLSNMLTDLNLTDMETCYKIVRTDLMQRLPLTAKRFGIEPELAARLAQAKARIYEAPISYHGRTYAEGKKINWKDGIAAFWHIVRFNVLRPPLPAEPVRDPFDVTPLSSPSQQRRRELEAMDRAGVLAGQPPRP